MNDLLPDKLLEEMANALVAELDPEAIYLFGSHAWGVPDEDSDIDLMVVVEEEDAGKRFELGVRARRALSAFSMPKDILIRSKAGFERFSNAVSSLEYDVVTDGRRIYARR